MSSSRRKLSGRRLVPSNRELVEDKLAAGDYTPEYNDSAQPLLGVVEQQHYEHEEPVLVAAKPSLLSIDTARHHGHAPRAGDIDEYQHFRDTTVIPLSKESVARESKEEPSFGVAGVARTPGDMLIEARKSKGMTIAQVANELHLKEDIVSALEEDRNEDIPGTTYARGYLRTYGRYLDIDDNLIAAWFADGDSASEENPAKITNTSSSATSKHRTRGLGSVMLLLVTLSIGTALWFGYQQDWFSGAIAGKSTDSSNRVRLGPSGDRPQSVSVDDQNEILNADTTTVEPAVAQEQNVETVEAEAIDDSVRETVLRANSSEEINFGSNENDLAQPPSEPVNTQIDSNSQPLGDAGVQISNPEQSPEAVESTEATTTTIGTDVAEVASVDAEPENAPGSSSPGEDNYTTVATGASNAVEATVVLRGKADSWVEVSDASGRKIFLDMVHTNETYNVVGTPPFRLLIGNAPGIDVEYEGFWVDVLGNTNDNNIARLILGQQSG